MRRSKRPNPELVSASQLAQILLDAGEATVDLLEHVPGGQILRHAGFPQDFNQMEPTTVIQVTTKRPTIRHCS